MSSFFQIDAINNCSATTINLKILLIIKALFEHLFSLFDATKMSSYVYLILQRKFLSVKAKIQNYIDVI